MKKSLLALAAMGAFAGTAQAQSSVTVYGTLDASVARVDTGLTTGNGLTTALAGSATVSDRLGFRGVEDLGGGKTAIFQLETGIAPFSANNGQAGAGDGTAKSQSTPGSFITTRRPMFVGLSDKALGTLQAGSMYSLGFNFTGWGDVAGNNTLGTNLSQATVVSSVADAVATTTTNTTAAFKMNANALQYVSPTWNGLTVTTYSVLQSAAASGAGKVNALGISYTLGGLSLNSVYEVKQVTTNSPAIKHTTMGLGAGYNFGVVNVRVAHQKGDLVTTTMGATGSTGTVSVTKFTAIAPVTPVIDIFGGYVMLSENAAGSLYGAASVNKKATLMSAGATYKFSKRTNVYAVYTVMDNDSVSNFTNVGSRAGAGGVGTDPNALHIGMRHSF